MGIEMPRQYPQAEKPYAEGRKETEVIRFSRGTVAISKEAALEAGLNLRNESSRQLEDSQKPPGIFFDTRAGYEEIMATNAAESERKIPVVIKLDITPENFDLIKRRTRIVEKGDGGKRSVYLYSSQKIY
ncbi:MAG TPA: hypothetical protein VE090_00045 [Methylomirabilota bacterium]|nr:hypothetical protein [Methylomirabilota bacterium]